MTQFDKKQEEDLKDFLFNSNIHDSIIESVQFNEQHDMLIIQSLNRIYNERIVIMFDRIKCVTYIKGNESENNKIILSLTVEEKSQYQKHFHEDCLAFLNNSVYLLFQMFSGDELHIVSERVVFNIHKQDTV